MSDDWKAHEAFAGARDWAREHDYTGELCGPLVRTYNRRDGTGTAIAVDVYERGNLIDAYITLDPGPTT